MGTAWVTGLAWSAWPPEYGSRPRRPIKPDSKTNASELDTGSTDNHHHCTTSAQHAMVPRLLASFTSPTYPSAFLRPPHTRGFRLLLHARSCLSLPASSLTRTRSMQGWRGGRAAGAPLVGRSLRRPALHCRTLGLRPSSAARRRGPARFSGLGWFPPLPRLSSFGGPWPVPPLRRRAAAA